MIRSLLRVLLLILIHHSNSLIRARTDLHELIRCNEVMNLIEIGIMMVAAILDERQYQRGVGFIGKIDGDETIFRTKPILVKYPSKETS